MELKIGKAINYNILIEPSSNMGFIVTVGCSKFVAQNPDILLAHLREYLDNPKEMENRFSTTGPSEISSANYQPSITCTTGYQPQSQRFIRMADLRK